MNCGYVQASLAVFSGSVSQKLGNIYEVSLHLLVVEASVSGLGEEKGSS